MELTKFNEKLNKVEGNRYTVEEVVTPIDGVYEADLAHDNIIDPNTINIYTGSKLTGDKINTYTISTPSLTPWKTHIKIFSDISPLYISYETIGDTVEADDINNVQDAINDTQNALNNEISRAEQAEILLQQNINTEITRAKNAESTLTTNLNSEITRAKSVENTLTSNLNVEIGRATTAESALTTNLNSEITRAKNAETDLNTIINTNKPIWDDKYTRNEIDNKISKVITDLDWKESVATYADLTTTYQNAQDGWTVNVKDTDITYRYSGTNWVKISANSIPLATSSVDGKMSKQDKIDHDDMVSKKHTHSNKSILDGITQSSVTTWNDGVTHISDTVKHITSTERTLWNTVNDKLSMERIDTATNFDTLIDNKLYYICVSGCTNTPVSDWGVLFNMNSGTRRQIYIPDNAATIYSRHYNTKNSTWEAWTNMVNKTAIDLGNVDNTSDLNKPISTATQQALDRKVKKGCTWNELEGI